MSLYIGETQITPIKESPIVLPDDEIIIKYTPPSGGTVYAGFQNMITEINDVELKNMNNITSLFLDWHNIEKASFKSMPNTIISFQSAFQNCEKLVSCPLSTTDAAQFNSFNATFSGCSSLTTVPVLNISNSFAWNGLYNTFRYCSSLSDESLNNIMQTCINATSKVSIKTLKNSGISSSQATRCQSLSNYEAFIAAGWTTGY